LPELKGNRVIQKKKKPPERKPETGKAEGRAGVVKEKRYTEVNEGEKKVSKRKSKSKKFPPWGKPVPFKVRHHASRETVCPNEGVQEHHHLLKKV